jgi:hypothetical protein
MKVVDSSEMLVNVIQTTRHHVPEDSNLHGIYVSYFAVYGYNKIKLEKGNTKFV